MMQPDACNSCPCQSKPSRCQFSLSRLFELTTMAAIVASIAAAFGPGTLVLSTGIALAWLNYRGVFESIQSGRRQAFVMAIAWATFLASLVLPSVKIFGPVLGFSAAWLAIALPVELLFKRGQFQAGVIVYAAIDIANALMLLLPFLMWRISRGRGKTLSKALCVSMVSPWCVALDPMDLMAGYFVWCASFAVALVAVRIRTKTFLAMLVCAMTLAMIVFRMIDR
jgi:hypothetical protein